MFIFDLLKSKDKKKKIIFLDINSKKKVILVSLKNFITTSEVENLGAKLFELSLDNKDNHYLIYTDTLSSKQYRVCQF